mgnify:CR=1 FL=1
MKLIIAEKPSVAAAYAAALGAKNKKDGYLEGNGCLVTWCIGHLVSLAEAGAYEERYKKWNYEDLPILPEVWQHVVSPGKEKQFSIVKSLMERPDVTELVNGCDAGREGELIFRLAVGMLHKTCLAALDFLYGGYGYPGGLFPPGAGQPL